MSIDLNFPIPEDIEIENTISSYTYQKGKVYSTFQTSSNSNTLSTADNLQQPNIPTTIPSRSPSPILINKPIPRHQYIHTNPTNSNSLQGRTEAATKRLWLYEENILLKSSGIEDYDITINTNDNDVNSELIAPEELISEHHRIIRWASKLTTIRSNPDELANLLLDINQCPRDEVRQKPKLAIFIKIEARDKGFLRFNKETELKEDYQKEYEKLEGRFIRIYKGKHKIGELNREVRSKIKFLLNTSLFIAYLRYINIFDLSPHLLAQIMEYGCNYLCRSKESTKLDYHELLQRCKKMFRDNLPELPSSPGLIPSQIKAKIQHRIPILDRSTTASVAGSLHSLYKFDFLPDSYFTTLPNLPNNPQDLPKEVSHLFPVKKRKDLKNLGNMIRELKRFFIIPTKIPSSYFDLPPSKIPLPSSPNHLEPEFNKFFPLDTSEHNIRDVVKSLRSRYFFERLPPNFFKSKELLPTFQSTINKYISKLGIQIPTTNPHDTQFLIKNLKSEYRFSLPLGPLWVDPEISQTDKPKLPQKLCDIDPKLNVKQLSHNDTLLREKIKTLHNHYEFWRIPENWFTNP
jgi:hypothetical protein